MLDAGLVIILLSVYIRAPVGVWSHRKVGQDRQVFLFLCRGVRHVEWGLSTIFVCARYNDWGNENHESGTKCLPIATRSVIEGGRLGYGGWGLFPLPVFFYFCFSRTGYAELGGAVACARHATKSSARKTSVKEESELELERFSGVYRMYVCVDVHD